MELLPSPCSQLKLSDYVLEDTLNGCIDISKLDILLDLLKLSFQLTKQGKSQGGPTTGTLVFLYFTPGAWYSQFSPGWGVQIYFHIVHLDIDFHTAGSDFFFPHRGSDSYQVFRFF